MDILIQVFLITILVIIPCFPLFPHLITLANKSKVASHGISQVPLSPSLNLNSVLYIPNSPYNLISLSQLTQSLNCLITFNV